MIGSVVIQRVYFSCGKIMINLTIKQKLVAGIVIAIIASTSLVGIVAQTKAFETLDERLTTLELPTILKQIGGEVDKEVSVISSAAEQMANPNITCAYVFCCELDHFLLFYYSN